MSVAILKIFPLRSRNFLISPYPLCAFDAFFGSSNFSSPAHVMTVKKKKKLQLKYNILCETIVQLSGQLLIEYVRVITLLCLPEIPSCIKYIFVSYRFQPGVYSLQLISVKLCNSST